MERLKNIVMEDEISNLLKKKEIRSQIELLKTKKVWVLQDHQLFGAILSTKLK